MSIILGIFDGTHDAGACIVQDGQVIAACDEERLTRHKGQGGFPTHSVNWCLKECNLSWSEIDRIAMAGWINPNPALRIFRTQQSKWKLDNNQFYAPNNWWSNWIQFQSPFPKLVPKSTRSWSLYGRWLHTRLHQQLFRQFQEPLPPLDIYEHHKSHAASALFASGHSNALILVADGVGDGLALSLWKTETSTQSERPLLHSSFSNCLNIPFPHSLGLFYASITGYLGYKPFRHEGKITGLSARGNADHIDVSFPFSGPFPHRRLTADFPLYDWLQQLDHYSPEDIAAWLQRGIEQEIVGILRWAQVQFGNRPLVMAGGLMANVALNAEISTQLNPPDIFIFPNMGDAGLAVGAAYLCGQSHFGWNPSTSKISSVYWGPKITFHPDQHDLSKYEVSRNTETELINKAVNALKAGKNIARAVGGMEYGPRALGNRSILCSAQDPRIHQKLNGLLNRSEIMPFAPIMRFDTATQWLDVPPASWTAMDWMTITVQAKPEFSEKCPAVVHVDNSLRPQLVHKERQPTLWYLLKAFEDETGEPALINTSFNRHEEPIVCTATDALQAFEASGLDVLWLDQWWIERKEI